MANAPTALSTHTRGTTPCSTKQTQLFERHARPEAWRSWRSLARHAPPLLRPEFFALEEPLLGEGERVLVGSYRDGELVGALPLLRRGRRFESLASDHAPTFDYVGDPAAVEDIWRALHADHRWDTIVLDRLPASSVLLAKLPALAMADLCFTVVKEGTHSPFFVLPGHEARLSPKLKQNIRRCVKKLGSVEAERIATYSREALDEGLTLEGAAWKDAAGTSIASSAELRHFYRALARLSARRGELSLYFLRANGRRIAFLFALEDGQTLYALKTGYDPAFADYSPGHLLFAEVARDAERRGLVELDFMGKKDEWKRRWTERTRDYVTLVIYRPTMRGAATLVGRELVKPRLPLAATPRIAAIRDEITRHTRHCQRDDIVGVHTTMQRIAGRVHDGLGIKSGARRVFGQAPATPKARLGTPSRFADGSWVRVKSADEVRATLDAKNRLRGLVFVPAQFEACGHVYKVVKSTRRIMDDHGEMRAVNGTVLIEGVTCDGHGGGLGCGRHCPLMFRDEWLEPAEAPEGASAPAATPRWARVRSVEEIEATLDRSGRRDGVAFMHEMKRFAGRRLAIVRRLERVYEHDRWTAPRGPIYLLEGASCTGAALGEDGPCDRACTLLWHGEWLDLHDSGS